MSLDWDSVEMDLAHVVSANTDAVRLQVRQKLRVFFNNSLMIKLHLYSFFELRYEVVSMEFGKFKQVFAVRVKPHKYS